ARRLHRRGTNLELAVARSELLQLVACADPDESAPASACRLKLEPRISPSLGYLEPAEDTGLENEHSHSPPRQAPVALEAAGTTRQYRRSGQANTKRRPGEHAHPPRTFTASPDGWHRRFVGLT